MSTVSVITPNFNYELYIEHAVNSVLSQTVPANEYFVVDDCSTDGSVEIINSLEGEFHFIQNDVNLGIVENFRQCVNRASSDYICFIGADNCIDPTYIEKLKNALDENPGAAIAYSDMIIFGPLAKQLAERVGAEKISHLIGEPRYHWTVAEPTTKALANIHKANFINGSAMFRRTAYEAAGGYRKSAIPEDADLFHRIIKKGYQAVYVPEPLLYYRQHSPEQANTLLLHKARIQELQNSLNESQKWIDKLQRDINEIQPYARKLERDYNELRAYVDALQANKDA